MANLVSGQWRMVAYKVLPVRLARINRRDSLHLRSNVEATTEHKSSFDYGDRGGEIHPLHESLREFWTVPNGASFRVPESPVLAKTLQNWRGKADIAVLPAGLELPSGVTVYHEHSDHYSMQPTKPFPIREYEALLLNLLDKHAKWYTREEFMKEFNIPILADPRARSATPRRKTNKADET